VVSPRWEKPFLSTTHGSEDCGDNCPSSHYGKWKELFCMQCMQVRTKGQNGPNFQKETVKIGYLGLPLGLSVCSKQKAGYSKLNLAVWNVWPGNKIRGFSRSSMVLVRWEQTQSETVLGQWAGARFRSAFPVLVCRMILILSLHSPSLAMSVPWLSHHLCCNLQQPLLYLYGVGSRVTWEWVWWGLTAQCFYWKSSNFGYCKSMVNWCWREKPNGGMES